MWLRDDGTPYYVGKGSGTRAFVNKGHRVRRPTENERIILQEWPCETDAFEAEKFLIAVYGRMDNGTGILANLTDGGENPPKCFTSKEKPRSASWCAALSRAKLGKKRPDAAQYLRNNELTPEERKERGRRARAAVKNPSYPPKGVKPPCRIALESFSAERRSAIVKLGHTHRNHAAARLKQQAAWTPERRERMRQRMLGSKLFTEEQILAVQKELGNSRRNALAVLRKRKGETICR